MKKRLILLYLFSLLKADIFADEHPLRSLETHQGMPALPKKTTENWPAKRQDIDPKIRFSPINFKSTNTYFSFGVANVKRIEDAGVYVGAPKYLTSKFGKILDKSPNLIRFRVNDFETNPFYSSNFTHPFVLAGELAYRLHRPFLLSPDQVWLLILQGVSLHISQAPEKYRTLLVKHIGKKTLVAKYLPGSETPWGAIVDAFSRLIYEESSQQMKTLLSLKFTTSTQIDNQVRTLSGMELLKEYFDYETEPICGIPYFKLTGTPADWLALREAVRSLENLELDWWLPHLRPVLDEFVKASNGNINQEFWDDFITVRKLYGTAVLNGWINVFFPYKMVSDHRESNGEKHKVSMAGKYERNTFSGSHHFADFPSGLADVRVLHRELPKAAKKAVNKDINITSGFIGLSETKEGEIGAITGWLVRPYGSKPNFLNK